MSGVVRLGKQGQVQHLPDCLGVLNWPVEVKDDPASVVVGCKKKMPQHSSIKRSKTALMGQWDSKNTALAGIVPHHWC